MEPCALCGRAAPVERHHCVPRFTRRRLRAVRRLPKERLDATVPLCGPCHKTVHRTLNERELALSYNTPQALAAEPRLAAWVRFIRDKPPGFAPKIRRPKR